MPARTRPSRASKQGANSSNKKLTVKGNNRFGSKGCIKCEECRSRKTKCFYDENDFEKPCADCKRRNQPCIKAFPTTTSTPSRSPSTREVPNRLKLSTSPTPSETSDDSFAMSPGGSPPSSFSDNDQVRPIIAVGAPGIAELASSKLKLLVDWVADLEIRYPSWSQEQVLRNARETIENGAFGAKMRVLIYEDHPHNDGSDSGMSMTEQLHETETVYTPAYIEQPVPVPGYSHFRPATTVSSAPHTIASLTEYNEDFNFTEALERASASSFSSDDTPYTDQGLDAPLAFEPHVTYCHPTQMMGLTIAPALTYHPHDNWMA